MKTKLTLQAAQVTQLETFINSGKALAREIKHANVLLKLNQDWTQEQVAQAFNLSQRTVVRIKQRCEQEGVEAALHDKPRSGAPPKISGPDKAMIIATACTPAPVGHERWTLRLLADRLVEMELIEAISHETVRQVLKKTNSSPGKSSNGAFLE